MGSELDQHKFMIHPHAIPWIDFFKDRSTTDIQGLLNAGAYSSPAAQFALRRILMIRSNSNKM
jgi:hypothetical protein